MVNHFRAQVVGWPSVRAYRRTTFNAVVAAKKAKQLFLKVSIDGVPYISSKVALRMCKGYRELRKALDVLFLHNPALPLALVSSSTLPACGKCAM
jgi:auxin-responsive protein IAA